MGRIAFTCGLPALIVLAAPAAAQSQVRSARQGAASTEPERLRQLAAAAFEQQKSTPRHVVRAPATKVANGRDSDCAVGGQAQIARLRHGTRDGARGFLRPRSAGGQLETRQQQGTG